MQLREFKYLNVLNKDNLPVPKSPRKSVKEYIDHVDDFVEPFDNFLEESVMEIEDFMLVDDDMSEEEEEDEELKKDFIDEEDRQQVMVTKRNVPFVTNTSLMLLRLCGKYLHLMHMLEPISDDVFSAMTMLLDFYLMNVYDLFTSGLVSVNLLPTAANHASALEMFLFYRAIISLL